MSMCVAHSCLVPMDAEEGIGPPGTGGKDSCELPCEYQELNQDPLQEQPVLLAADTSGYAPRNATAGSHGNSGFKLSRNQIPCFSFVSMKLFPRQFCLIHHGMLRHGTNSPDSG